MLLKEAYFSLDQNDPEDLNQTQQKMVNFRQQCVLEYPSWKYSQRLLFKYLLYKLMCMCLCESLCRCVQVPAPTSGARVTCRCEPPLHGFGQPNLGPQHEQCGVLTAAVSISNHKDFLRVTYQKPTPHGSYCLTPLQKDVSTPGQTRTYSF